MSARLIPSAIRHASLTAAAAAALVAIGSSARAPESSASASAPAPDRQPTFTTRRSIITYDPPIMPKVSPPVAIVQDGFRVELREVAYSARRAFGPTAGSGNLTPNSTLGTLSITMAVQDAGVPRIYRVRRTSAVQRLLDETGGEFVRERPGRGRLVPAPGPGGAGPDFIVPTAASPRRETLFTTALGVNRSPSQVSEISGELQIDLVERIEDFAFPVPALEEPVRLAPGITAVVKLLDADPASGEIRRLVIEIETPAPTDLTAPAAPGVQSVELTDADGNPTLPLRRVEEYALGAAIRTRYVGDDTRSRRPDKPAQPRPPLTLRIRAFTESRSVTIPFRWGPIQLVSPDVPADPE